MKISIFGLGYVGCVTAAVMTKDGHTVIGVDVNKQKIEMLNSGDSPIIEKDVDVLIKDAYTKGLLTATNDAKYAIQNTDVSVICVGTPSSKEGTTDLVYIKKVIEIIKNALIELSKDHTIIVRSTIPPGTIENLILPHFKEMSDRVGVCFNPEFLREGTAVADYFNPPYIVAAVDSESTKKTLEEFYKSIDSEIIFTSFKTAESLKMVNNVFHALKIVFANEIKRFCEGYNLDAFEVMDLVCRDKKLNISTKYLKPGFAYGGSCLPKDLKSFVTMAKKKYIKLPVLEGIAKSNDEHIADAIEKIFSFKSKKIGMVGISFKPGTDDLRESPYVRLVEYFLGKGYNIKIYDPNINVSKLMGANKEYIEKELGHIDRLLVKDLKDVFENDIILLARNENIDKFISERHFVLDLR